jgi:lysophospholipase L1-like esterase
MKTSYCSSSVFGVLFFATTVGFSQVTAPLPSSAAPRVASPATTPVKEDPAVPVPRLNMLSKDGPYMLVRHKAYVDRIKQRPPQIAFFGDSITEWWMFDFDKRYGPYGAANFGIGGDKTQNLLWRICNGEMEMKPKVAVVLIGTNNLSDDLDRVSEGIIKIVQTIQEKSPDTKVLLLGIFPRGWDENQYHWYVPRIQKVNATIAKLDDGEKVRFLDIGNKLLEPGGTISRTVFKDGLHLSALGYQRWGDAMQPLLEEMVGKPLPCIAPIPAPAPVVVPQAAK